MRKLAVVPGVIAFTFLFTAVCDGRQREAASPDATICLHSAVVAPPGAVERAKLVAKNMFAGIGVNIVWRGGTAVRQVAAPEDGILLNVELTANESGPDESEILAESYPFAKGARSINIRYDRVHSTAGVSRDLEPVLLAHVLVHEITHVLQCVDRHAEAGVMKARWTSDDYADMRWKPLEFTPEDVELIRLGMQCLRAHLGLAQNNGRAGAVIPRTE